MLKIKYLNFEDLTAEEKENVPNNGFGKEYASYIKIIHNDKTICLKSDAMEPEDACFCRDLSWIKSMLETCYELGKKDGNDSNF